jgi:hypothetical protein
MNILNEHYVPPFIWVKVKITDDNGQIKKEFQPLTKETLEKAIQKQANSCPIAVNYNGFERGIQTICSHQVSEPEAIYVIMQYENTAKLHGNYESGYKNAPLIIDRDNLVKNSTLKQILVEHSPKRSPESYDNHKQANLKFAKDIKEKEQESIKKEMDTLLYSFYQTMNPPDKLVNIVTEKENIAAAVLSSKVIGEISEDEDGKNDKIVEQCELGDPIFEQPIYQKPRLLIIKDKYGKYSIAPKFYHEETAQFYLGKQPSFLYGQVVGILTGNDVTELFLKIKGAQIADFKGIQYHHDYAAERDCIDRALKDSNIIDFEKITATSQLSIEEFAAILDLLANNEQTIEHVDLINKVFKFNKDKWKSEAKGVDKVFKDELKIYKFIASMKEKFTHIEALAKEANTIAQSHYLRYVFSSRFDACKDRFDFDTLEKYAINIIDRSQSHPSRDLFHDQQNKLSTYITDNFNDANLERTMLVLKNVIENNFDNMPKFANQTDDKPSRTKAEDKAKALAALMLLNPKIARAFSAKSGKSMHDVQKFVFDLLVNDNNKHKEIIEAKIFELLGNAVKTNDRKGLEHLQFLTPMLQIKYATDNSKQELIAQAEEKIALYHHKDEICSRRRYNKYRYVEIEVYDQELKKLNEKTAQELGEYLRGKIASSSKGNSGLRMYRTMEPVQTWIDESYQRAISSNVKPHKIILQVIIPEKINVEINKTNRDLKTTVSIQDFAKSKDAFKVENVIIVPYDTKCLIPEIVNGKFSLYTSLKSKSFYTFNTFVDKFVEGWKNKKNYANALLIKDQCQAYWQPDEKLIADVLAAIYSADKEFSLNPIAVKHRLVEMLHRFESITEKEFLTHIVRNESYTNPKIALAASTILSRTHKVNEQPNFDNIKLQHPTLLKMTHMQAKHFSKKVRENPKNNSHLLTTIADPSPRTEILNETNTSLKYGEDDDEFITRMNEELESQRSDEGKEFLEDDLNRLRDLSGDFSTRATMVLFKYYKCKYAVDQTKYETCFLEIAKSSASDDTTELAMEANYELAKYCHKRNNFTDAKIYFENVLNLSLPSTETITKMRNDAKVYLQQIDKILNNLEDEFSSEPNENIPQNESVIIPIVPNIDNPEAEKIHDEVHLEEEKNIFIVKSETSRELSNEPNVKKEPAKDDNISNNANEDLRNSVSPVAADIEVLKERVNSKIVVGEHVPNNTDKAELQNPQLLRRNVMEPLINNQIQQENEEKLLATKNSELKAAKQALREFVSTSLQAKNASLYSSIAPKLNKSGRRNKTPLNEEKINTKIQKLNAIGSQFKRAQGGFFARFFRSNDTNIAYRKFSDPVAAYRAIETLKALKKDFNVHATTTEYVFPELRKASQAIVNICDAALSDDNKKLSPQEALFEIEKSLAKKINVNDGNKIYRNAFGKIQELFTLKEADDKFPEQKFNCTLIQTETYWTSAKNGINDTLQNMQSYLNTISKDDTAKVFLNKLQNELPNISRDTLKVFAIAYYSKQLFDQTQRVTLLWRNGSRIYKAGLRRIAEINGIKTKGQSDDQIRKTVEEFMRNSEQAETRDARAKIFELYISPAITQGYSNSYTF